MTVIGHVPMMKSTSHPPFPQKELLEKLYGGFHLQRPACLVMLKVLKGHTCLLFVTPFRGRCEAFIRGRTTRPERAAPWSPCAGSEHSWRMLEILQVTLGLWVARCPRCFEARRTTGGRVGTEEMGSSSQRTAGLVTPYSQ